MPRPGTGGSVVQTERDQATRTTKCVLQVGRFGTLVASAGAGSHDPGLLPRAVNQTQGEGTMTTPMCTHTSAAAAAAAMVTSRVRFPR